MMSRFFEPRIDWAAMQGRALARRVEHGRRCSFLQGRQTASAHCCRVISGSTSSASTPMPSNINPRDARHSADAECGDRPVFLDEAKERAALRAGPRASPTSCFSASPCSVSALRCSGAPIIGLMTHGKFDAAGPYVALLVGVVLVQISGRPQYAELIANGRGRYLSVCNVVAAVGSIATLVALVAFVRLVRGRRRELRPVPAVPRGDRDGSVLDGAAAVPGPGRGARPCRDRADGCRRRIFPAQSAGPRRDPARLCRRGAGPRAVDRDGHRAAARAIISGAASRQCRSCRPLSSRRVPPTPAVEHGASSRDASP